MSAIVPQFGDQPITCDVVAAVTGGQVVETRAPSGSAAQFPVGPAGAASTKAVGVALLDATNAAQSASLAYPLPVSTVVATKGVVPVTFTAAATYGQYVICAAAGQVTPYTSGTNDFGLVIGKCVEPLGVGIGAVGRMRILNCS